MPGMLSIAALAERVKDLDGWRCRGDRDRRRCGIGARDGSVLRLAHPVVDVTGAGVADRRSNRARHANGR